MEIKGVKSLSIIEIAWLAGIIEGEGCFQFSVAPVLTVNMTDEDVISRVASLWKKRVYIINGAADRKTVYRVTIHGSLAVSWMFTLYTFMGWRRKRKIREIVERWKSKTKFVNRSLFPCGHLKEETNLRTDGACRTCGNKRSLEYYRKRRMA